MSMSGPAAPLPDPLLPAADHGLPVSTYRSPIPGPRSPVPNPPIPDPQSRVPDPESPIPDPESPIHDPRSSRSPHSVVPSVLSSDRSWLALLWYRLVQQVTIVLFASLCGVRASGRHNMPAKNGAILVSNHLSHLDVFVLGLPLRRPLNYVARSTLFFPPLGFLIRSLGGFPIQREGIGVQGMKETLRRLRAGGVVTLFPEGTRSRTGELGTLKTGIGVLAARTGVPIVPAAIAGTFQAWPRHQSLPRPHPVRVHYGPSITPDQISGLDPEEVTALIRDRILDCQRQAQAKLAVNAGD
jgi:1-acyl-sn-glycerol-3-phosphate acyltransferase